MQARKNPLPGYKNLWYTVYDPRTDQVLASGRARTCALRLGTDRRTFLRYVSRGFRGVRYCPYDMAVEDLDTGIVRTCTAVPPIPRPRPAGG